MATTIATPNTNRIIASGVAITAVSTVTRSDIVDRRALTGPAEVYATFTDTGASQTITFDIQGSNDATNWYNVPYALIATPSTFVVTSITFSTGGGGSVRYLLQGSQPYRYISFNVTAVTAMTLDATVYCFAP